MHQEDNYSDLISEVGSLYGESEQPYSPMSSVSNASKKRKLNPQNETNEILRQFLKERPKPADFLPQEADNPILHYFKSMALDTMKFSPMAIARIKAKLSQAVSEEELIWAAEQAEKEKAAAAAAVQTLEYVFVDPASNTLLQNQEMETNE